MPLKIDLRAQEKLFVGNSTIFVASDERSTLIIDGTLPIIRERDLIRPEDAKTPLLLLTRAVQIHYLSPGATTLADIYKIYFAQQSVQMDPIKEAMRHVAEGDTYKALRLMRQALAEVER
jgi:flagellar protein FlbT